MLIIQIVSQFTGEQGRSRRTLIQKLLLMRVSSSLRELTEYVAAIDQDPKLYARYFNKPIFSESWQISLLMGEKLIIKRSVSVFALLPYLAPRDLMPCQRKFF